MRFVKFFALFNLLMSLLIAQTEQQILISDYNKLLSNGVDSSKFIGTAGALILNGEVVWKESFGYSDRENKIGMTNKSTLCIGSVSKPITAMAVMMLHQQGKLNINDPVVKYIPEFKINSNGYNLKNITIKSLLDHTSGLPKDNFNYTNPEWNDYKGIINILETECLRDNPDLLSHYSNLGYGLLGYLIKKVSGKEYPDFMHKHFFKPLGMLNTGFNDYKKLENLSITYNSDSTPKLINSGRNLAAGSIYSNVNDMLVLAKELIEIYHGKDNSILSPVTVRKIFSQTDKKVKLDMYKSGIGWSLFKNDSSTVVFHLGSNHVSNAAILIEPEKKNALVLFVNTVGGLKLIEQGLHLFVEYHNLSDSDRIYMQIIDQSRTEVNPENVVKNYNYDELTGTYALSYANYKIEESNDSLYFIGGKKLWLNPVSENEFIPTEIFSRDSISYFLNQRFYFKKYEKDQYLFWENNGYQYLAGKKNRWNELSKRWDDKFGVYENNKIDHIGWDKFKKVEVYSENGLIKLKVNYTSGEYIYNLYPLDENHLAFYDLGEPGSEVITFTKEGKRDLLQIFGLKLYR